MKKVDLLLFLFAIILIVPNISYSIYEEGNMNNSFFNTYFYSDEDTLNTILHNKYNIEDLISYFCPGSSNLTAKESKKTGGMLITDVDKKFPIEVIRKNGYSVYKVAEGGYFFVFWAFPLDEQAEPPVAFSTYISGNRDLHMFDMISVGINDIHNVEQVDPYFELQTKLSNGIYSYSYIDPKNLVQIGYDHCFDDQSSFMVSSISVISRAKAPSYFRLILSKDLP